MLAYLHAARQRTLDRHHSADDPATYFYSGTTFALYKALKPRIAALAQGLVLDAGAGRGQWADMIEGPSVQRESVDIIQQAGHDLTWIGDLTSMPQVPSERYDVAMCNQVLEHVLDPYAAVAELHRVLKPGGRLLISVPMLSRLHEMPHDYFRYTPNGLQVLLDRFGFEVEELTTYGGLFCFLHHQISTIGLGLAATLGPFFYLALAINGPISVGVTWLDGFLDRARLMPTGVIAVARKPGSNPR